MSGSCPAFPNEVRLVGVRALRTAFIPAISLAQSVAGAVGAGVDVLGSSVGGVVVGSVEVGLLPLVLLVVILLALLSPCGVT
jgi:hypothetical protein